MAHKFDVNNKHKLDNKTRQAIMPPRETLLNLGLKHEDDIADIGCGAGYFSLIAGEIVGSMATVYAMDISGEMLAEVEKKTISAGIKNILTLKISENDFKTEGNLFDFVLISNVLHEAYEKLSFLREIKRVLKPGGKVAILEWQKVEGDYGPPIEDRIDKGSVVSLLTELEFVIEKHLEFGPYFYGLTGIKL